MVSGKRATTAHDEVLWRPDQYRGQAVVSVTATQLDHVVESAAQRRKIYDSWLEFFSSPTGITHLDLRSRVPQQMLDSLAGQPQLEALQVKWGPYCDIRVIAELPVLSDLSLGGATRLESLEPIRDRSSLVSLSVTQAHGVVDLSPLSSLSELTELLFGGDIGSDRLVRIPDVRWIEPLESLRTLWLPGTLVVDADLSPLLSLPKLEEVHIPLRRKYRAQVFTFADHSPAFARLAGEFEAYEKSRAALRQTQSSP